MIHPLKLHLLIIVLILLLLSCANQKTLVLFESSKNSMSITEESIESVSLENDALGKKYANIVLTEQGRECSSYERFNH